MSDMKSSTPAEDMAAAVITFIVISVVLTVLYLLGLSIGWFGSSWGKLW